MGFQKRKKIKERLDVLIDNVKSLNMDIESNAKYLYDNKKNSAIVTVD